MQVGTFCLNAFKHKCLTFTGDSTQFVVDKHSSNTTELLRK